MSLNKQITQVSGNSYAPSVSFNSSVIAPVNLPEVEKPKYRNNINLDIDIGEIVKSFAKADKEKADNESNMRMNAYAARLNEIVEGQRQGVYKQDVAERLIRQETDSMLSQGFAATDIAKVRNYFDGGINSLEEKRQSEMVMHEQKRELQEADAFRQRYSFTKDWSFDKVRAQKDYMAKLQGDVDFYNQQINMGATSKEELDIAMKQRGTSIQDLARMNIIMDVQDAVYAEDFDPKKVDANYISSLINKATNIGVLNGVDYGEARMIAEEAVAKLGLEDIFGARGRDLDLNTNFMKKVFDNITNTTKTAIASSSPQAAILSSIDPELVPYFNRYNQNLVQTAADNIYRIEVGKGEDGKPVRKAYLFNREIDEDQKLTTEASFNILKNSLLENEYPLGLFANEAVFATSNAVKGVSISKDNSPEQNRTSLQDIENIERFYNDATYKARKQSMRESNNPNTRAKLDIIEANEKSLAGQKAAGQMMLNDPQVLNIGRTLGSSLQADRLRIDPSTGNLVLIKGTTGALSSLGDFFASHNTKDELNRYNEALAKLDPQVRRDAITTMLEREIPDLQPGEVMIDTSERTTKEDTLTYLQEGSTALLQGVEEFLGNLPLEDTKSVTDALKTALERTINNSLLSSSVEKVLAKEQPTGFSEDTLQAAKNFREAGELEEAANRLEQQTANLSEAGTREYAEGNRKAIKTARAKASELRGSATRSGSEIIGGAQIGMTDMLNNNPATQGYQQSYVVPPAKDEVKISLDKNSPAIKKLIKERDRLTQEIDNMNKGYIEFNSRKYAKNATRIAEIEKALIENERED